MHPANVLLLKHQALEVHHQQVVASFAGLCQATKQPCEASALLQQLMAWQY